jgi:hypothetical protein
MPRPKKDVSKNIIKFPKNKLKKETPKKQLVKKQLVKKQKNIKKPSNIPMLSDDTPEDMWANGDLHKFKNGDVVEEKDGSIGVIDTYMPTKYKKYKIRWHTGKPNRWDCVNGEAHEDYIKSSTKPNPIDIPSWEKYPGPSSNMIKQIYEAAKAHKPTNIEEYVQTLEEDYKRRKYSDINVIEIQSDNEAVVNTLHDEEVDSIIDYTLESDVDEIVSIDLTEHTIEIIGTVI